MSSALLRVLCRAQTCLFDIAFRLFLFIHPVSVIDGGRKFFFRVQRFIDCSRNLDQAVVRLIPLRQLAAVECRVFMPDWFKLLMDNHVGKPA
jgi:hypothetical protein